MTIHWARGFSMGTPAMLVMGRRFSFAASSLVERSRVAVFDFRCLSDLLRCGQWVHPASFHHFPFDGFFFSLLGANVAIVAKATAGIMRTGEAAHDLHMCQDE